MKRLSFLFALVGALPLIASAEILSGSLQVNGVLPVQTPNGLINLNPGIYPAGADVDPNQLFMTVSSRPFNAQFAVNLPPNKSLPQNGSFYLSPMEVGQNWGLSGTMNTSEGDTPEQQAWEFCQYLRDRWVCGPYGCGWVREAVNGRRWVSFHDHYFDRVLNMDVIQGGVIGHFDGHSGWRNRVYTQMGACQ